MLKGEETETGIFSMTGTLRKLWGDPEPSEEPGHSERDHVKDDEVEWEFGT